MQQIEITGIPTSISGITCPACSSSKHKKNGKENGNQKYRCKTCGKHYRDTTGSSIHQIHKKQLIQTYIQCINEGLTLRKAAIKTGISLRTSFAWRHKLLSSLSKNRENKLNRRTITAAIQLPYSEKGKRKASTQTSTKTDKHTKSIIQTDGTGKIHIEVLNTTNPHSLSILRNMTDNPINISQQNLPKRFKQGTTKGTTLDIKTISDIQQSLIAWIDKFRGVATKYLHHYWAWYEQANDFEISQNHQKILIEKSLMITHQE